MNDQTGPMRVLLVTQYFYPENFKSNDMAFELAARGYEVTVLTGIPNYPQGSFHKGYGWLKRRKESIKGVEVIRASLLPRGKGGGTRLALNYFSWAFFASVRVFFLSLRKKYDVILVHEPSPVTQGIPAVVAKKMMKAPLYFWVLDLWPESLVSAGGVTNRYVLSFFEQMVKWIYNHSDKILISSRGFSESILQKGDYKDKLIYFPNWAESIFEDQHTFNTERLPDLPEGFRVMFAGNIGEAQDFENIMQAALLLREEKSVRFVLIGDGRKKDWVEGFIREHGLEETVYCPGRYPLEAMPAFFRQADVLLLALKDELIFNLTVPAKLQAYMAFGKPVVAMLNGEGGALIEDSGCGRVVKAGDSAELAHHILKLSKCSREVLESMGERGKSYCKRYFDLNHCMDHLENIIKST